jgi:hypothetical protein
MSQHMDALKKANQVRLDRFEVKKQIKELPLEESREAVAKIIAEPGELWTTARLDQVLRMGRQSGRGFSQKVRSRSGGLTPVKELGALTERQRGVVIEEMRRIRRKT